MNNLNIKYKDDIQLSEHEQAAGFPPFSRGYHTLAKKAKLITLLPENYIEVDFNEKGVSKLFSTLHKKEFSSEINIVFNFEGASSEIAYSIVLRTLLAIFLQKQKKDSNDYQFVFYAKSSNSSLNTLNAANVIGIDFLIVSEIELWKRLEPFAAQFPVDPLYGNKLLIEKIEALFFSLKKNLSVYF